ncbi:GGDEF domain-containing protein [Mycobacterium sp. PSTR-4-N]|uniref:GGDEF domain-containing protein n=1 Tax=Mycobacterium sp. PSTR-4-N TaxID=2917745 RepID=UPI001F14ED6E|nr:diguanylate cyclase [Mycobacterium sp. PSTR-4-N]MCG7594180.1 GGDEF domain-containing protein [Mycobacterium sp. PSTR-4-N]
MERLLRSVEHYDWITDFLDTRGLKERTRFWLAATTAAMAAGVMALTFGAGHPDSTIGRAMMAIAVAGGLFGTVLFLWRWPSRHWSLAYVAATTLSITLACLAYPDPLASLLGCIAFTTIVSYAAFFHSPRVVLGVLSVVIGVAVSQTVAVAAVERRPAMALVDLFLILQCSIGTGLVFYALVRTLRGDLAVADLDPLTGLLNRRAFRNMVRANLTHHGEQDGYLLVALLDLDRFKAVNDTRGHAAGDRALVAVADALRATATPTTVIARSGGEEFLFADVVASGDAALRYEDVRAAIAQLPCDITSSIGTALLDVSMVSEDSFDLMMDQLITAADKAMYDAKHNGGNRCRHHGSVI